MKNDRRKFLKGLGLAGVAAGVGLALGTRGRGDEIPEAGGDAGVGPALTPDHHLVGCREGAPPGAAREGVPGRKWVMVIDLAKCDGCEKCVEACGKMHAIPSDRQWIRVYRMPGEGRIAPYYMPRTCLHCDNPPCTKVCPVNATYKRTDGIVLVDNTRCIGCRFCMAACPYSVRVFNWGDSPNADAERAATGGAYSPECGIPRRRGTVEKCDLCVDRARAGLLPHCASGCPMGAIYFGDEVEDAVTNSKGETRRLTALLEEGGAYRLMEDLGTAPRLYYLPPKNREYPAPGAAPGHRGAS